MHVTVVLVTESTHTFTLENVNSPEEAEEMAAAALKEIEQEANEEAPEMYQVEHEIVSVDSVEEEEKEGDVSFN